MSPLLDLESGLDIVWGLPLDEFHLVKEGLTKLMLSRMLWTTQHRESRDLHNKMNLAYRNMAVLSEMPRRTRSIQQHMKGSELGVIAMSLFPHVAADLITEDKVTITGDPTRSQ